MYRFLSEIISNGAFTSWDDFQQVRQAQQATYFDMQQAASAHAAVAASHVNKRHSHFPNATHVKCSRSTSYKISRKSCERILDSETAM